MATNELIREKELQVLDFLYFWGRPIRVGDISEELKIKHSTINSVLNRLVKEDLIAWEKYGPVILTEKGKEDAAHLSNHHFIIEKFLKETLNLSDEIAHKHAIQLSGRVDCELIEAICKKYHISHKEINTNYCDYRNYPTYESN